MKFSLLLETTHWLVEINSADFVSNWKDPLNFIRFTSNFLCMCCKSLTNAMYYLLYFHTFLSLTNKIGHDSPYKMNFSTLYKVQNRTIYLHTYNVPLSDAFILILLFLPIQTTMTIKWQWYIFVSIIEMILQIIL